MKIILGTAQFGMNYGINNPKGKIPKEEAFKILKYAKKNGIDTLDTANVYGDSQENIGEFMKNNNIKFKIISKLPSNNIETHFYNSLKKLDVKKIYCCLIHDNIKDLTTWSKMVVLKNMGLIEKIGFSVSNPSDLNYVIKNKIKFDIIQLPYNIFDQRFSKFFQYFKENGIEIHTRSVFLQGLFFKNPNELTGSLKKAAKKLINLRKLAHYHELSISEICINFVAMNKYISKIIIGVNELNDLKENIKALQQTARVKCINKELLKLREDDENIVFPVNWRKTTAIIQARMGSTRLPGKVMMKIKGKSIIKWVISNVKRCKLTNKIILATSIDSINDVLVKEAKLSGIEVYRGSENDVLDRYYQAAVKYDADPIVRITGDCPLIDPEIIDNVIRKYFNSDVDYVSNALYPSFPDGLDVECFSFAALEKAWKNAKLKTEREYLTSYLWNNKDDFKLFNISNNENLSYMRWTLDEKEDFELIKKIIIELGNLEINLKNVLNILKEHPEWIKINEKFMRNEGYQKSLRDEKNE